ncbi:FAD/FMN-containing dehydrogenase [Aspergillus uvarum CBS 121591]|uniref:FAD/FMN-containing dehydrogenase n=1 Tax=Aspergillus uvarum CBS 121591 TaxID=1448315 RepID=A0A319CAE3_9EURO|nr:FAD/FMN-containing dehydrogenase [Aspergillus uvarum CBS 121591]PYH82445.1 FAD/FMN-containing dehydrogenase [Aspergillus uvarum CBS 121591]
MSYAALAVQFLGLAAASCSNCSLSALNTTVGGRVQPLTPFSLPCFSSYNGHPVTPNDAACATIQANYSDPYLRTNTPNGYMNYQDEMCSSNPQDQCVLDSSDPTDPLAFNGTDCRQGNMPSYYLEVHDATDVSAALEYSRCSGVRVVIKNSGHDYLGRSSGKGTLQLWTRNLQDMSYHARFVPKGCPANSTTTYNAITAGAGVNFDEAYAFAHDHNVTILGGYSPTVGLSGGWVQMGGHSVLSPVYGLGVDRVVQYKVVTPDGNLRIANECQNPDLFWALRGGGGGTFGVVLESTHRVEPRFGFTAAIVKFTSNSTNVLPWMDIIVNNTLRWAEEGWGGHITGSTLINVSPLMTVAQAKRSLASVIAYAQAQGGSAVIEHFASWYDFYSTYVTSEAVSVGVTHFAGSRLVPRAVFETAEGRENLMDFFKLIQQNGQTPYIPVVGPVLYNYTEGSTSATPAWRQAVWELGSGSAWAWNSTLATREAKIATLQNMTATLERITPGSGAYSNEANPFTEDWREAWWGTENYDKLLTIKHKYDPSGLLSCWKCIGWQESQANSTCFAAFQ